MNMHSTICTEHGRNSNGETTPLGVGMNHLFVEVLYQLLWNRKGQPNHNNPRRCGPTNTGSCDVTEAEFLSNTHFKIELQLRIDQLVCDSLVSG